MFIYLRKLLFGFIFFIYLSGAVVAGGEEKQEEVDLASVEYFGENGIPPEIEIYIFSFLGPIDLSNCTQVCKHWQGIIVGNLLQQKAQNLSQSIKELLQKVENHYNLAILSLDREKYYKTLNEFGSDALKQIKDLSTVAASLKVFLDPQDLTSFTNEIQLKDRYNDTFRFLNGLPTFQYIVEYVENPLLPEEFLKEIVINHFELLNKKGEFFSAIKSFRSKNELLYFFEFIQNIAIHKNTSPLTLVQMFNFFEELEWYFTSLDLHSLSRSIISDWDRGEKLAKKLLFEFYLYLGSNSKLPNDKLLKILDKLKISEFKLLRDEVHFTHSDTPSKNIEKLKKLKQEIDKAQFLFAPIAFLSMNSNLPKEVLLDFFEKLEVTVNLLKKYEKNKPRYYPNILIDYYNELCNAMHYLVMCSKLESSQKRQIIEWAKELMSLRKVKDNMKSEYYFYNLFFPDVENLQWDEESSKEINSK